MMTEKLKLGNKELKHKLINEKLEYKLVRSPDDRRFVIVENFPGLSAEMTYKDLLDISTQLKDIALRELGPLLAADELVKKRDHWPELEDPLKKALTERIRELNERNDGNEKPSPPP